MTHSESLAHVEMDNPERIVSLERPLVIEIIPGQAAEGLIDIFDPGSYEGKPLRKLVEATLAKDHWSVEERQVLEDIRRQLNGGKLLHGGQEIHGDAAAYAVPQDTDDGERYLYVTVRAIRAQEGGAGLCSPC